MSVQSSFVALKCNACGAKLRVPVTKVVEREDGAFAVVSNATFICEHCGAEYLSAQQLQRYVMDSGVVITGGSVTVGGHIAGGDLIIKSEHHTIKKKWWQFWK